MKAVLCTVTGESGSSKRRRNADRDPAVWTEDWAKPRLARACDRHAADAVRFAR